MTVGVAIKCKDGIVVACDSLATFGRGVPVARYTNKVNVIKHDELESPVALIGAGISTFVDKFLDKAKKEAIDIAAKKMVKRKLDIIDFSEYVGETVTSALFKEYVIDRHEFFGAHIGDYALSLIIAGATRDGELRAYFIHSIGLTETVEHYGTIGSGAAYAELFLRDLMPDPAKVTVEEAACLAVYAIKGVEIMDPYVGGDTSVCTLQMSNKELKVKSYPKSRMPKKAKEKMEKVLRQMGENMRSLIN